MGSGGHGLITRIFDFLWPVGDLSGPVGSWAETTAESGTDHFSISSMVSQASSLKGGARRIKPQSNRSTRLIMASAVVLPRKAVGAMKTANRKCSRWETLRNHRLALSMSEKSSGFSQGERSDGVNPRNRRTNG